MVSLGEVAILEWVQGVKTKALTMSRQECITFTNPKRCKMVREAPAYLQSFVVGLGFEQDIGIRDAADQLDKLNTTHLIFNPKEASVRWQY